MFTFFKEWKPSTIRAVIAGLIFLLIMTSLWVSILTIMVFAQKPQKPVDVFKALSSYQSSQFFAQNYLLVWLSGTSAQRDTLLQMSSAFPQDIELNSVPITTNQIEPVKVSNVFDSNGTDMEWNFVFAVTMVTPGTNSASRHMYSVTTFEKDSTYQALTYPVLTSTSTTPIKVATGYGAGVDTNGALGTNVKSFVEAYYTSKGTAMGQYVSGSGHFASGAIKNSPYTSVEVTGIRARDSDNANVTNKKPAEGTTASIIVTFKAFISNKTFSTMQVPLDVVVSNNGQWVVDKISAVTNYGVVSAR